MIIVSQDYQGEREKILPPQNNHTVSATEVYGFPNNHPSGFPWLEVILLLLLTILVCSAFVICHFIRNKKKANQVGSNELITKVNNNN